MASILDLMNHVQQQGDIGTQRAKTTRLGQLMAQGYQQGGDRSQLMGQIAQVDPNAALGAQKSFGAEDDAKMERIGQMANMLLAMPAETRAQAYPQIAQQLHGMGMGQGLPDQWDESMLPTVQNIAQQLGGVGKSADMQKFNAMTQGLSPEEIAKARRINLGLDPRAVTGAMRFDTFSGADGRPRPQRNNPTTGQVEIFYDEMGQWVPLGGGAGGSRAPHQAAPTQADMEGDIQLANDMVAAGIPADRVDAFLASRGQRAESAPAQGAAPIGGSGLGVGRSPEEEAFAKERATQAAQLGALPERGAIEAQNAGLREDATQGAQLRYAGQKKAAEFAAERRSKALADLPVTMQTSQQTIDVIDKALNHPGLSIATGLSSKLDPRNFVPGQPGYDFGVVMDQLKGKAFLEAFATLKGGGQITEVEGKKATDAIARLNTAQSEAEFKQSLRELRQIAKNAQERAIRLAQGQQPASPQAPQSGGASDPLGIL